MIYKDLDKFNLNNDLITDLGQFLCYWLSCLKNASRLKDNPIHIFYQEPIMTKYDSLFYYLFQVFFRSYKFVFF